MTNPETASVKYWIGVYRLENELILEIADTDRDEAKDNLVNYVAELLAETGLETEVNKLFNAEDDRICEDVLHQNGYDLIAITPARYRELSEQ